MTTLSTLDPSPTAARAPGFLARRLQRGVLAALARLRSGAVQLTTAHGSDTVGNADGPLGTVRLRVDDPAFFAAVAFGGALGAGESYLHGQWRCDDPVRLVRLLLRDRDVLQRVDGGSGRLLQVPARLLHALRANTRRGARANIAAHYDLGNDFFAAWLDPSMTYSAARFPTPDTGLAAAQEHKLDLLCRRLELQPGERLLEIGTGWGALAMHAAGRFGAQVTTTTISARQHQLASERVRAAGLQDRVQLLQQDYRDLRGSYDKVVAVEMVEAVGHRFLPGWFGACAARLRPGGRFVVQAITIQDRHYHRARRQVDFIKKHIFPGSFIPSPTALLQAATAGSDLRLLAFEDFGADYARTLQHWRANLHAAAGRLRAAGYPPGLLAAHDWYLAYCEAGFAEQHISVAQLVFTR